MAIIPLILIASFVLVFVWMILAVNMKEKKRKQNMQQE